MLSTREARGQPASRLSVPILLLTQLGYGFIWVIDTRWSDRAGDADFGIRRRIRCGRPERIGLGHKNYIDHMGIIGCTDRGAGSGASFGSASTISACRLAFL